MKWTRGKINGLESERSDRSNLIIIDMVERKGGETNWYLFLISGMKLLRSNEEDFDGYKYF
jgi:hypothetical protein